MRDAQIPHASIPENMDLSFIEHVLRELPSNIYLKDAECRYVFATKYWDHINHGDDPEWSIKGKTDFDIRKNRENAQKAYDQDCEILKTGVGCRYTIEEMVDGKSEYLEITKSPVRNDNDEIIGIVGLVHNVTEKETMRRELERLANTDALTGLFNRLRFSYLAEEGLAESEYPAAVIFADCDNLKKVNDDFGHLSGNDFICKTAQLLRDSLPQETLIFRTGGDEFAAVLPGVDEDGIQQYLDALTENQSGMVVDGRLVSVSIGHHIVGGPDEDMREAFGLADENMYNRKCERRNEGRVQ